MSKDEKKVLTALGVILAFKAALYGSIVYSSRYYRSQLAKVS